MVRAASSGGHTARRLLTALAAALCILPLLRRLVAVDETVPFPAFQLRRLASASEADAGGEFAWLKTVRIAGRALRGEEIRVLSLAGNHLDGARPSVAAVAFSTSHRFAVTAWRVTNSSDKNSLASSKYFRNTTDPSLCSVDLFGVASHQLLSTYGAYTGADKLNFTLHVRLQQVEGGQRELSAPCRSNINDFRAYTRDAFPNVALLCTFAAVDRSSCEALRHIDSVMALEVRTHGQHAAALLSVWYARAAAQQARRSYDFGVCVPMPFRNEVSGPTIAAFVSYYAQLGFKVAVYDKYGAHQSFLQDWIDTRKYPELDYFPYTMEELMFPELPRTVEVARGRRNIDKSATYSHCKAEYANVKNVLIVDYDEFLLCQASGGFEAQREAIAQAFARSDKGELLLLRKHLTNSTEDVYGCAAAANPDDLESLFRCYERQQPDRTRGAPKVMSISGICPFFWVHGACTSIRSLGCKCNTGVVKSCHLVHLNHGRFAAGGNGGPNPLLQVVAPNSSSWSSSVGHL